MIYPEDKWTECACSNCSRDTYPECGYDMQWCQALAIEGGTVGAIMKCPKCGSDRCYKDGTTVRKGGIIPATRCKDCGYRGPAQNF